MKNYFKCRPFIDNPYRLPSQAIVMLLLLGIGLFIKNLFFFSFASIGFFTFFYYRNIALKKLLCFLMLIGSSLVTSFILSVYVASYQPWLAPLAVGVISFFSRLILNIYRIRRPGALFFAMISSMGASFKIPLTSLPIVTFSLIFGVATALVLAIFVKYFEKRIEISSHNQSFIELYQDHPLALVDSVFYGIALFFSVYISQGIHFQYPYWVALSCASILMVENLEAMKYRHIQYLLGSFVGLSLSIVILCLPLPRLFLVFTIPLFYTLANYFTPRNYAIANFFLHPMSLLLSSVIRNTFSLQLIEYRLFGIIIGSCIGFGTAWIMTKGLGQYIKTVEKSLKWDKLQK